MFYKFLKEYCWKEKGTSRYYYPFYAIRKDKKADFVIFSGKGGKENVWKQLEVWLKKGEASGQKCIAVAPVSKISKEYKDSIICKATESC